MLTKSLKNLEEYKLIRRDFYSEIPPRVEYSMTETGEKLIPSLQMMISWDREHFQEIMEK